MSGRYKFTGLVWIVFVCFWIASVGGQEPDESSPEPPYSEEDMVGVSDEEMEAESFADVLKGKSVTEIITFLEENLEGKYSELIAHIVDSKRDQVFKESFYEKNASELMSLLQATLGDQYFELEAKIQSQNPSTQIAEFWKNKSSAEIEDWLKENLGKKYEAMENSWKKKNSSTSWREVFSQQNIQNLPVLIENALGEKKYQKLENMLWERKKEEFLQKSLAHQNPEKSILLLENALGRDYNPLVEAIKMREDSRNQIQRVLDRLPRVFLFLFLFVLMLEIAFQSLPAKIRDGDGMIINLFFLALIFFLCLEINYNVVKEILELDGVSKVEQIIPDSIPLSQNIFLTQIMTVLLLIGTRKLIFCKMLPSFGRKKKIDKTD